MPTVIIEMLEGRTVEQKALLAKKITDVIVEIFGSSSEAVTVIYHELPKTNLAKGGALFSERKT
jgi:4-oxalocrotonate tautomerase